MLCSLSCMMGRDTANAGGNAANVEGRKIDARVTQGSGDDDAQVPTDAVAKACDG